MLKEIKKYSVKDGAHIPKAKADVYGRELERISDEKGLTAENVVNEAKKKDSPIHEHFEWNDSVAAGEYRLVQARLLIRSIVVWDEQTEDCHRAFLMVSENDENVKPNDVYVPIQEILDDKDMTAQVLAEAVSYLKWFRKKYSMLKELVKIHRDIDELE